MDDIQDFKSHKKDIWKGDTWGQRWIKRWFEGADIWLLTKLNNLGKDKVQSP